MAVQVMRWMLGVGLRIHDWLSLSQFVGTVGESGTNAVTCLEADSVVTETHWLTLNLHTVAMSRSLLIDMVTALDVVLDFAQMPRSLGLVCYAAFRQRMTHAS